MKNLFRFLFSTLLVITLIGCTQQKVLNRHIKLETGERILTGEFDQSVLKEKYYASWYDPEYTSYEVETEKLKDVKSEFRKYEIEAFVGTWCSDSQRELPRLLKILESVKYPIANKMKLYGVNSQKKSFYGEEIGKDISHVPTIIFYLKGKEVGRIVESPMTGYLEEDIAMIIKGTPLTPNYAED
ncbi:MAG: thioredoxin family protein [Flavobacteriaceae bacterium]|nr:thioredoxin family protein [Candidatus Onthonaster equi]